MTIEEKITALLAAALPAYGSPAVELVPAARIKVPGDWQDIPRPYVVHFPAAVDPIYTHSGLAGSRSWSYQVSSFAETYTGSRAVADACMATLSGVHDGVTIFWRGRIHQREQDTRTHHIADEYDVFEAL